MLPPSGPPPLAGADGAAVAGRQVQRLAGVVIASSPRGALVEAGGRHWLMAPATDAAAPEVGTRVRIELGAAAGRPQAMLIEIAGRAQRPPLALRLLAPAAAEPGDAPPSRTGSGPGPAPVLATLTRALAQADAPGALRLPQAEAGLAASLLRLLAAIGGQGGAASGSGAARPAGPHAAGIEHALGELARIGGEPLPGGWRLLLLPFGGPDEGLALRLFLQSGIRDREDEGGRERGEEEGPRRAIFELELSHLGRCQLDALCEGRGFRLMIRTARELAADLRHEIADAFLAACAIGGLQGRLGFAPGALLELPGPLADGGPPLLA